MWLFRRLIPVILAGALSACGFHPLYMKESADAPGVAGDLTQVKISNGPGGGF